jgi:hypothetical protein
MQSKKGKTHRTYHMMLALTFVARCTEKGHLIKPLTVQGLFCTRTQIEIAQICKIDRVENDAADRISCILVHGSILSFEDEGEQWSGSLSWRKIE